MEVHNMYIKYRASQHLQILPTLVNLGFFLWPLGFFTFIRNVLFILGSNRRFKNVV